jgi:hypothetical protein
MMYNQAIKVLAPIIEKHIGVLSFDANLHDKGIAAYPLAKRRSEEREEVKAAWETIQGIQMRLDI